MTNDTYKRPSGQATEISAHVYTQKNCPSCDKVKALLLERGINAREIDIATLDAEDYGYFKNTYKTTPQVFLNGVLVGGYEATEKFFTPKVA